MTVVDAGGGGSGNNGGTGEGVERAAPVDATRRAAAVAGHLGDEVTARLALADDDAAVVGTALGALARMGRLTTDDVTRALADPRPAVRRRALEVQLTAGLDVSTHVLRLLDDPDPTVVEVAAWACGERRPPGPGAVSRLASLATDHDDALVREAAVAALGAVGDPAGLPAVLSATRDKVTVRRRAVLALAAFTGPDVDAALARAAADRDWQVRQAAEDLS